MSAGTYFGKYFLLKRLAQGGMGEIYIARQSGPGGFAKTVALKKVLPHLTDNKEFTQGFLGEAALSAKMQHRNIVAVFDFGLDEESNSYFLTMEYVAGKPFNVVLETCVQRKERMPLALIRDIAVQMCDGMSYAHNLTDDLGQPLNLVHRDLNPSNLLVSYNGDVKIIDWGIAKSEMSQVKTEAGMIKGKFVYMSPEQSMAKKLDKRSDIFAGGITLYEMLTGENPFHKPNVVLSLEAIQRLDPPPPSEFDPALAAFDPICAKALAKDREKRYQDFSEMAEDLKAIVVPPASERLGQFIGRLFRSSLEEEQKLMQDTANSKIPPRQQQSSPGARLPAPPAAQPADEEKGGTLVMGGDSGVSQDELRRQMDAARKKLEAQQQAQRAAAQQRVQQQDAGGGGGPPQRTMFIGAADLQPPPQKSGGKGLLIGGIVAGVLVGIVGVGAFFFMNKDKDTAEAAPTPVAPVVVAAPQPDPAEEAKKKAEAEAAAKAAEEAAKKAAAEEARKRAEAAAQQKALEEARNAAPTPAPTPKPAPAPVAAGPKASVLLRSTPALPVLHNNAAPANSMKIAVMKDVGIFQLGDASSPLRISLSYKLDGGKLVLNVDSDPWSIIAASSGESGKTPRAVTVGSDMASIEFKRPGQEPIKVMMKVTQ